jgi:hypothetical protein
LFFITGHSEGYYKGLQNTMNVQFHPDVITFSALQGGGGELRCCLQHKVHFVNAWCLSAVSRIEWPSARWNVHSKSLEIDWDGSLTLNGEYQ